MNKRGPKLKLYCEIPNVGHAPSLCDQKTIEKIKDFLKY